jgi:hypothetical protein
LVLLKERRKLEGCLTVHLPHEIIWNANLMEQGNFVDVFLFQKLGAENNILQLNIQCS